MYAHGTYASSTWPPAGSQFFFSFCSSRRRHTRLQGDWSSDVCSSDLKIVGASAALFLATLAVWAAGAELLDRKSTRLNSSHLVTSYAVFCLKKKKGTNVARVLCSQTVEKLTQIDFIPSEVPICCIFFFNDTATTEIYTLSLHDALPIYAPRVRGSAEAWRSSPFRCAPV